ncbi:MAG TPA: HAMP domain-containing sensor histidine kinase, partial [Opitutaceae bacterium]|nr:HAMP domain-containing sensor histidine kinase [Opitutaceae bacterium]
MKIAYPLWLKISLWLLLNLLLLAALGVGFIVVQGGLGWSALVAGPTGDRVQTKANAVAGEVFMATVESREEVLARFGAHNGAQAALYRFDQRIAGPALELPAEVRKRIESGPLNRGGRGGFGPRGPDGADGSPRESDGPRRFGAKGEKGEFGWKGEKGPPAGEFGRGEIRQPPDPIRERERGRFLIRAGSPATYWIGLRTQPMPERGPPSFTMLVARIDSLWTLLRFLDLQSWLLGVAVVLGLSLLFWLPLVGGMTRAIGQLTRATEQIAEGKFDARVATERSDELGRLGESVNRMATRLDAHMTGQKRFLGDVAHELCSPLARLQMATGILDEQAPPALRPTIADVRDEVQQMSTLVNELLAFTKAGLTARDVQLVPVDLAPLAQDVIAREDPAHRVVATIAADLRAQAEPHLLARALGNLVRNALRYGGETGAITVGARRENQYIVLTVDDEGPGVPAGALDRLGEPFFRP